MSLERRVAQQALCRFVPSCPAASSRCQEGGLLHLCHPGHSPAAQVQGGCCLTTLSHLPLPRRALHQLWSSCLVIYSLGLRMKGAFFSGSFLLTSTLLLSRSHPTPHPKLYNVSGTFQVPLLGYMSLLGAFSPAEPIPGAHLS